MTRPRTTDSRLAAALRQAAFLGGLALVPATLSALWHREAPALAGVGEPGTVTWPEARNDPRFSDALWIDARPAAAFAAGHQNGALRLTEAEWEPLLPLVLDAWQPGRPIIVYCDSRSCAASSGVAARLRSDLGTEAVFVLRDGWLAMQP